MNTNRTLFPALTALALALTLSATSSAAPQGDLDPASFKGKQIPSFKMTTLEGKTFTSQSLRGKVVLIDFWATWCSTCAAASKNVEQLYAKYGKKGVMVIGANVEGMGGKEAQKLAIGYRNKHKYTYTFTYGNESFAESLGVQGLPLFLIIDKKGKVTKVQTGFGPKDMKSFEAEIVKALKS